MPFDDLSTVPLTGAGFDRLDRSISDLRHRLGRSAGFDLRPIPTGSRSVDAITGFGGLPRGQLVHLADPSPERADALLHSTLARVQSEGGVSVVIDVGGRFSAERAAAAGVESDRLHIVRIDDVGKAFAAAGKFIELGVVDLLVIDLSTDRSRPQVWVSRYLEEKGLKAGGPLQRDLSELAERTHGSDTCVMVSSGGHAAHRGTALGEILGDLSGLRIRQTSAGPARPGAMAHTGRARVVVEGMRGARQLGFTEFGPAGGIYHPGDLLEVGSSMDLVTRRGSIYRYGDEILGRGRAEAIEAIESRLDLRHGLSVEIEQQLEALRTGVAAGETAELPVLSGARRGRAGGARSIRKRRQSPTRPKDPARTGSKRPNAAPAAGRYVNTWLEGEDVSLPLVIGHSYTFNLQIAPQRTDTGGGSTPFEEPDFGGHPEVLVLISLYSEHFEIESASHTLPLPRTGPSPIAATGIVPRRAGTGEIRIVISLLRELEVLQRLRSTFEIGRARDRAHRTRRRRARTGRS